MPYLAEWWYLITGHCLETAFIYFIKFFNFYFRKKKGERENEKHGLDDPLGLDLPLGYVP